MPPLTTLTTTTLTTIAAATTTTLTTTAAATTLTTLTTPTAEPRPYPPHQAGTILGDLDSPHAHLAGSVAPWQPAGVAAANGGSPDASTARRRPLHPLHPSHPSHPSHA